MKLNIQSIIGLAILFALASCKKDFLDKAPDDDLSIEKVFNSKEYAQNYLNNVYSHLPIEQRMVDNDGNGNPFVGASDDMEQFYNRSFSNEINQGAWDPTTLVIDPWSANYSGIRKANIFIENVDKVPLDQSFTEAQRTRWKGEAMFLRAYYHFLLMRVYGPIPISGHSIPFTDDLRAIRRDPIDECVAFVASECDNAAALLPPRITATTEYGRPSKAVCLALKARVLLYMASPLWNGNPDYAGIKNDDDRRLFPDADDGRWQSAADAAKACIDQAEAAGYRLHKSADGDPIKSYWETFYLNNNEEAFFSYNAGFFNDNDVYSDPRSIEGFTLNSITQNIVDDYEMANGTRPILGYNADLTPIINPGSGYTETGFAAVKDPDGKYVAGTSNMYVNREPRFYASILFSGAPWKERVNGLEFWDKGADGRAGAGGGNYTKTGYLPRKFSHPNFRWRPNVLAVLRAWILFRLGEQYLNYAEALNEAQGPVADVYKYVNLIRSRAGLPGLPTGLSKDDMRERIRHERRIEMFFEAHRYFDAHRWKIAEQTEGGNIIGLNIFAGINITDPAFYKRVLVEKRVFQKKHYLWPIQQRERDKNPQLVQNFGW